VGLTLAGTVFATRLVTEIPAQLLAQGVPPDFVKQFAGGGASDIVGTGDLGQRILASLPPNLVPVIQPILPNIVRGIYDAVSIAIASTFWVGIVAAVIAAATVLFLHETPMRATFEMTAPAPVESERAA
jgi:hypothetical protein